MRSVGVKFLLPGIYFFQMSPEINAQIRVARNISFSNYSRSRLGFRSDCVPSGHAEIKAFTPLKSAVNFHSGHHAEW